MGAFLTNLQRHRGTRSIKDARTAMLDALDRPSTLAVAIDPASDWLGVYDEKTES